MTRATCPFVGAFVFAAILGTAAAQMPPAPNAPDPTPAGNPVPGTTGNPLPTPSEPKSLGDDRYAIGSIVVDKRTRSFTVPGHVHVLNQALEYFASTPKGMKAYEALLDLDTFGSDLNLACILIGLERDPDLKPFRKGGATPITGPRVAMTISWKDGDQRKAISAAEAIGADPATVEWVYTGSPVSQAAKFFVADRTGTLIGFIHDPATVIEAVNSIGAGAYGSIKGHASLPPVGSAIELRVSAVPSKP